MESWLELEKRFRSLTAELKFCRLDAQWGAAGEYWQIAGSSRTPATEQFEILSSLAGQLLQKALTGSTGTEKQPHATTDPKLVWYNALKSNGGSFGGQSYAQHLNSNGTSAGFIFTESVNNIADAAANLCLALHAAHPPVPERKNWWQWVHDNYVKALIIGTVLAIVGAAAKWVFASAG